LVTSERQYPEAIDRPRCGSVRPVAVHPIHFSFTNLIFPACGVSAMKLSLFYKIQDELSG